MPWHVGACQNAPLLWWRLHQFSGADPPSTHACSENQPPLNLLFGAHFGLQTAKMASEKASKTAKTALRRLKMAQDSSRGSQDSLKTAQDSPRGPQDGPRRPQDGPRGLQETLQERPRRPKPLICLRCLKYVEVLACSGSRPPKTAQEVSKRLSRSARGSQKH